ncbi:arylsulfatase [Prevotella herbatica]|uniref:Arylsulfatase n=1 Tax=Prevotella herbatica TaxID=2801997 RepID=A0ABM7NVL9_9BACT|nr:sulfatase-like hydrolase/transferase [Prevotella herbatica]BCS84544.1 arylsulfatase [Prevotella herbatica]
MNTNLLTGMISALTLVPTFGSAKNKKQNDQRPNILLILADDMGKECLGCYGSTYNTPNLDAFAEEGVKFNYATSQPLSTPSRVELLTGKYNYKNYSKFAFMNQDQKTFANLAQEAGYKTCIAGKWQLGENPGLPKHFGFDNYCLYHLSLKGNKYAKPLFEEDGVMHKDCTENDYGPDYFSNYICNFIEKNYKHPFLAYYSMTLVHDPFNPTPESDDWDIDPKKRYAEDNKYFPDMVHYTDKLFAKVMKKLKDLGIEDNTIVIFIGDNGTARYITTPMKDGTMYKGGKAMPIEAGTAVPMIARWGKYTLPKHTTSDMVDFTDFMPTFADAMKINVPSEWDCDGHSFLPVLEGKENPNKRDYVFVHYQPNHVPQAGLEHYSCRYVKDHNYKLYSDGSFFNYQTDPEERRGITRAAATHEENAIRDKFRAILNKLPKWKLGDKCVKQVILPEYKLIEQPKKGPKANAIVLK